MTILKASLIQQSCEANTENNLASSIVKIREAATQGAQLIILQELHRSLYFCQQEDVDAFNLAETIPGPTTNTLGKLAGDLGIVIIASLFEKRAAGIFHNTAVVFDTDGSIAGQYRKMHIPDDPGFYEKFYFTPGDQGFIPISTSLGNLGVLICWDQWFPEAARLMAMAGADILIYPTAIGWDLRDCKEEQARQRDAWITVQRGHAISNGIPVISVNRVGFENNPTGDGGIHFWGSSFAVGAQGEFLHEASQDEAETALVEIDLARSESLRRIWPFFRDRRIDAYSDITKVYCD